MTGEAVADLLEPWPLKIAPRQCSKIAASSRLAEPLVLFS